MKIIQSFAEFEDGNFYLQEDGSDWNNKYLNFYSFLLSCLTLQKYYGKVTMYCNQKAMDSFIKYIPYNEIKIMENTNDFVFWSYYKVDVMKRMRGDFIHVDSDVFIFDDLFAPFINGNYDIIVQDRICLDETPLKQEAPAIFRYLKQNGIINIKKHDGEFLSCGTVGMTNNVKKEYLKLCDILKNAYINKEFNISHKFASIMIEEFPLHLLAINNKYRVHEILPHDEILKHGAVKVGNKHKYTHMWFGSKFNPQYVELIKKKIKKDFPKSYFLLEKYEKEVFKNVLM